MALRIVIPFLAVIGILSCIYYLQGNFIFNHHQVVENKVNYPGAISDYRSREPECNLDPALIQEIANYQPIVNRIVNSTLNGVYKGRTWRLLARFVDKFGSRIAGSKNLENAIDYMLELLERNQLENIHTEPALVPHWVRGKEYAWMVKPRLEKLNMLGLGLSIGTPVEGITAEVLVVKSFDELLEKADQVLHQSKSFVSRKFSFFLYLAGKGENCRLQRTLPILRGNC